MTKSAVDLPQADLVACVDGPLAGQWFFAEDWKLRVDAASYMRDVNGEAPQACLGYVRDWWTADPVKHPHYKRVTGHGLHYNDPAQPSESAHPARRSA